MNVTHEMFFERCNELAIQIQEQFNHGSFNNNGSDKIKVFGIPRGGVYVAYVIESILNCDIVSDPKQAHFIVDDILDSGRTMLRYSDMNPSAICLHAYNSKHIGEWVVFPWEISEEGSAEDIPIRLLQFIGEDLKREGLSKTPMRFLSAWKEWTIGYNQDPRKMFTAFEDGAKDYDEMIVLNDIPVYSQCEHHLAPFFGEAIVGYIPDKKILGLSKISRIVDIYARRLQVQERLTTDICNCINELLRPIGVGVIIKCRHLCMESRGISRKGIVTTTSAIKGWFKTKPEVRQEFLRLAK